MLHEAWIIWFEDADKHAIVFSGEGAERAAHRTFKGALTNWNCHLFKTIELDPALVGDGVPPRSSQKPLDVSDEKALWDRVQENRAIAANEDPRILQPVADYTKQD